MHFNTLSLLAMACSVLPSVQVEAQGPLVANGEHRSSEATSEAAAAASVQVARRQIESQITMATDDAPAMVDAAVKLAQARRGPVTLYFVQGGDARRNREVTGPVSASVQGVPAQPVHSAVWDGVGHERVSGESFWMVVDPVQDQGVVQARWRDSHGRWNLRQSVHIAPPHPTALRVGADAAGTELITDSVQTHGYQHGNTGAGGPLMPSVFQHLASFGPTKVKLNGRPFVNPFPGSTAPEWFGAFKVSDGVRGSSDGIVRNSSGGVFNPMQPQDGATDPNDMEIQCIFHDDAMPPPGNSANFPPRHRFFYWLNFEDVSVQVMHFE